MNKAHAKQLAEKHLDRYMKSDGNTIKGLLNEADWFFEVFNGVEYQLRVNALKQSDDKIAVIVAVDDQKYRSAVIPLCVSDFRTEGDSLWTEGTRKSVEEKRDRYSYAKLGGEDVSYVTPGCAFRSLEYLETALSAMNDRVVYVVGYTNKTKREIRDAEDKLPVQIVINKSVRKGFRCLLPFRMARVFLLKITGEECLVRLFHQLDKFLLIRYGILNEKSEKSFLDAVNNSTFEFFGEEKAISDYMKKDDMYVSYKINTSGRREDAPFIEYVSLGKNAPEELVGFHLK